MRPPPRLCGGEIVIDVRNADEYTAGHLPRATFMPLPTVSLRISELNRHTPVYVICETGARALQACQYLQQHPASGAAAAQRRPEPHREPAMNLFSHTHVPAVSAVSAMEMLKEGAALIDIREMDEWSAGHAPMAIHVPMTELAAKATELSPTTPTLFICRSGRRSDHAVGTLVKAGYNAINLDGGMQARQRAGGAAVREDGSTGTMI